MGGFPSKSRGNEIARIASELQMDGALLWGSLSSSESGTAGDSTTYGQYESMGVIGRLPR
jgi:hypothetical protein